MAGDAATCCLRSIGLGTIRNLFVCIAVMMSLLLVHWVHSEQNHIAKCTQIADRGLESHTAPPVHVMVQIPPQNLTQSNTQVDTKWDYNWDHRAWSNPQDAYGVPTRTIILVRHGQYDFATGILNDRGRHQANLTGARLQQLNMNYDRIVHSNMPRAIETAHLVHAHLSHLALTEDPLMAEGGPVPPEPTVNYWSLPDRAYYVDGPRLEAAFRKYFYRADKSQEKESIDILVGHANIFRYFALRALQFPKEGWMRIFIAHASISLFHINPDGSVTMTKLGDSGHLPPDMVTI